MGNYIGGYGGYEDTVSPVDPEEERRRREEEARQAQEAADAEVAHEQKVTTYADGTKTVTTKQEVPAEQPATRSMGPVAPSSYMPGETGGMPNAAYTARMESGNNPNIGYHDRTKGTAYGTYGITAPAYQDVQRANPAFAGRPIESLTPAEQTQAYQTYTGLNAQQLQRQGVEPTEANQRLAHFLGASGAARYLNTGEISPQAAAANGGMARAQQIAQQRLAGSPNAQASGAARVQPVAPTPVAEAPAPVQPEAAPQAAPEQAQPESRYSLASGQGQFGLQAPGAATGVATSNPAIEAYQSNQNDPMALMKLSNDPNAPDWIKERARDRAADVLTNQRDDNKAKQLLAGADNNELAKYLRNKGSDSITTRIRGMLFALAGNKEAAAKELDKLDTVGKDTYVQGPDGKSYLMRVKANGEAIAGYNAETGEKLSDKDLVNTMAGVQAQKGTTTHTGKMQDTTTGEVYYEKTTPQGIQLVDNNGKIYKGSSANLRPFGIGSDITTKNQIQINELQNKLAYAGPTASAAEREKVIAESEAKYGPLPDAFKQSVRGAQPQPAGTAQGAAVQRSQGVQPVAPTPMPAGVAVQPQAQGVQPVAAIAPGMTPAQREQATKLGTVQGEANIKVSEAEQKQFAEKTKTSVGEAAQGGLEIGSARRQQLDLIKQNPSILNIMNGTGTQFDSARNMIVRMASGAYSDDNKEALYKDIKNLGLSPAEQGALTDFANLNTGINAKTLKLNSGAGSISNAEQQANKDANIGNIDRITAYAALSGLYRSQFAGDLQTSKQAFLDKHPEIKTDSQYNSAWQKEESNLLKGYQGIAKARFDVMGRPPEANASKEAMAAYKDRVFKAFEAYPAPTFDTNTGSWNYQTANAKRAAMKQILGQ